MMEVLSPQMKDFIEQKINLIENDEFKTIYNHINEMGKSRSFTSQFTRIMLSSGINPLLNMWYIPKNYLYGCGITDPSYYIINEGIKEIDPYAYESSLIKTLICPSTLQIIGKEAFAGCIDLQKISFNEGLTEISEDAFAQCYSLEELYFPDSLTHILKSAFEGCSKLKKISLPKNISTIRFFAFEDCPQLQEIEFRGTVEEWRDIRDNTSKLLIASNAFPNQVKKIKCLDGEAEIKHKRIV